MPVSTIAIRPDTSTGKKEEDEIDIIPTNNSLQYVLCGLGHELLDQGRHGIRGAACAPAPRGAGARPLHVQVRRRGRLGLGLPSPAARRPGGAHVGLPEEERRAARSSSKPLVDLDRRRRRRRSGRCRRGSSRSSTASRSRGSTRTSTSRRRTAARCSSTPRSSSARSLEPPARSCQGAPRPARLVADARPDRPRAALRRALVLPPAVALPLRRLRLPPASSCSGPTTSPTTSSRTSSATSGSCSIGRCGCR